MHERLSGTQGPPRRVRFRQPPGLVAPPLAGRAPPKVITRMNVTQDISHPARTQRATGRVMPPAGQLAPALGVRPSRTSMRFDPAMTLDGWKLIGAKLSLHSDATCWWLGDWLAFGRTNYGRRYREGIAVTGLEYKTLRNYAVVARAFEWSRRRHELSFQHHAEVCALAPDEQDMWLDLAIRNGWSKSELRRRMRARARDEGGADANRAALHLTLEPARHARWAEAAKRAKRPLGAWVAAVLDEAAGAALDGSVTERE